MRNPEVVQPQPPHPESIIVAGSEFVNTVYEQIRDYAPAGWITETTRISGHASLQIGYADSYWSRLMAAMDLPFGVSYQLLAEKTYSVIIGSGPHMSDIPTVRIPLNESVVFLRFPTQTELSLTIELPLAEVIMMQRTTDKPEKSRYINSLGRKGKEWKVLNALMWLVTLMVLAIMLAMINFPHCCSIALRR